jgi:hypothetical protein
MPWWFSLASLADERQGPGVVLLAVRDADQVHAREAIHRECWTQLYNADAAPLSDNPRYAMAQLLRQAIDADEDKAGNANQGAKKQEDGDAHDGVLQDG